MIGGTFLGFWLVLDSLIFAVLLAVFLAAAPWYLLRPHGRAAPAEDRGPVGRRHGHAGQRRQGRAVAGPVAGILAAQCPRPINAEFHQIVAEYQLGKPLERTLNEAKDRLKSENFALFAAAMLASHESGGRLNETVERIAHSVLEMQRLERKVMSETAQARKSAVYMASAGPDSDGLLLRRPGTRRPVHRAGADPAGDRRGAERDGVPVGACDFESGYLNETATRLLPREWQQPPSCIGG